MVKGFSLGCEATLMLAVPDGVAGLNSGGSV